MNLLWLQGLTCNGNTQSFLCSEDPPVHKVLEGFNLLFHPALTYNRDVEEVLDSLLGDREKLDVFIFEGAVSDDVLYKEMTLKETVRELARRAEFVIALGSCAVYGNIPALFREDISGLLYRFKVKGGALGEEFGKPVINLSGCPVHPSWLAYVLDTILRGGEIPLDEWGRPKELYAYLTHHGCIRNEYFEWKVEAKEFGTKEGCLFYYLGCRGPMTHSSCNRILWNGVSSKTRAGLPCFGCTEYDFPRVNLFKTFHVMGLPEELPLGVSKRGYILLSGIAKTFAPQRLKEKLIDEGNRKTPHKA